MPGLWKMAAGGKNSMTIKHAYNLKYYKLKLWERIVLYFVKVQFRESPDCIMFYKTFANRFYLYGTITVIAHTVLPNKDEFGRN
jgi:hypothetical protein